MANSCEKTEINTLFWGTRKSLQIATIALKFKKILQSRNITLLTKVHLFKAMVFPIVMDVHP